MSDDSAGVCHDKEMFVDNEEIIDHTEHAKGDKHGTLYLHEADDETGKCGHHTYY